MSIFELHTILYNVILYWIYMVWYFESCMAFLLSVWLQMLMNAKKEGWLGVGGGRGTEVKGEMLFRNSKIFCRGILKWLETKNGISLFLFVYSFTWVEKKTNWKGFIYKIKNKKLVLQLIKDLTWDVKN